MEHEANNLLRELAGQGLAGEPATVEKGAGERRDQQSGVRCLGQFAAIGAAETVALFKEGSAEPASNRTAIVEFQVEDVEAEFARLKDDVEVVHEPKMMPWGNRAAQFRDPEGTLVGMYTPVTEAAKKRFGGR